MAASAEDTMGELSLDSEAGQRDTGDGPAGAGEAYHAPGPLWKERWEEICGRIEGAPAMAARSWQMPNWIRHVGWAWLGLTQPIILILSRV